jgi:hypothetical protein
MVLFLTVFFVGLGFLVIPYLSSSWPWADTAEVRKKTVKVDMQKWAKQIGSVDEWAQLRSGKHFGPIRILHINEKSAFSPNEMQPHVGL